MNRIKEIWLKIPGEVRGAIIAVALLTTLLVFGAIAIGLENLWTRFWEATAAEALGRGFALVLATLVLSVIGAVVLHRFTVERVYKSAVQSVKDVLDSRISDLERLVSEDLPNSTAALKDYNAQAQESWSGLLKTAHNVVKEAAKGALRDLWLSHPWEYMDLLEQVDSEHSRKSSPPGMHIDYIALYGTMVGFAFLMPEAIRNHICRAGTNFRRMTMYASDAELGPNGDPKALVHYPLYLTAQLVQELVSRCQTFAKCLRTPSYHLDIEIVYFPNDLLNAAIYMPPREIVIMQALDRQSFWHILDEQKLQVGFRYANDLPDVDAYDRFDMAMKNLAAYARKREVWKIRGGSPLITITNPHWTYDKSTRRFELTTSAAAYDNSPEIEINLEKSEVFEFLESMLAAIRAEGSSGTDVKALEEFASRNRNAWNRRHGFSCPCSEAPQLRISAA